MPEAHSQWSASNFKKIMLCPGSVVLEAGRPNTSSAYAAEGTAAHELLERCLTTNDHPATFVGQVFKADGVDVVVDADMAHYIQQVVELVHQYQGDDGVLMVEQRLHYAEYLGVERDEAWGTGDVVIARGDELIVCDLKYGRGVAVAAAYNPQLMLYGLGALAELNGLAGDFERVRLVIFQPRISATPSEWDLRVRELEEWGYNTAAKAVDVAIAAKGASIVDPYLTPGEEQCRFCKAKATCPKLRAEVEQTVFGGTVACADDFADATAVVPEDQNDDWLAAAMSKAGLIEDWIKAVRAEVERRLLAGDSVKGWKVVQGKQGNRAWSDKTEVEAVLKSMRLKQEEMYDFTIISPTAAEKLLAKESPRRWAKLQGYITRSEGKPHVAPASDKRPALEIKPVSDEFETIA